MPPTPRKMSDVSRRVPEALFLWAGEFGWKAHLLPDLDDPIRVVAGLGDQSGQKRGRGGLAIRLEVDLAGGHGERRTGWRQEQPPVRIHIRLRHDEAHSTA